MREATGLCFILLIAVWPLSLFIAFIIQVSEGREKGPVAKNVFKSCLVFSIAFPLLLAVYGFCDIFWPYRNTVPSPTGDYALEQRYMDWGPSYRCHTYLLANNRYYKISNIGPGGAYWDDEETFSVGYRFYEWHGKTYTVSDFTGEQTEKGADLDAGL